MVKDSWEFRLPRQNTGIEQRLARVSACYAHLFFSKENILPNWCRNELHVRPKDFLCPEPELEVFREALRETIDNYAKRLKEAMKSDDIHKTRYYWGIDKHPRGLFDFKNFIPYPQEYAERDFDASTLTREEFEAKYGKGAKDGYSSGGHEWCIKNWGTKWSASTSVWVDEHRTLHFDTPWGPAFPIISEIHKRFPEMNFYYEYYESGMGFMGGCEFITERDWNLDRELYVPMGKEHEIEKAMKETGKSPEFEWEAGRAYNFWESDYKGFKGG